MVPKGALRPGVTVLGHPASPEGRSDLLVPRRSSSSQLKVILTGGVCPADL